ncbi:conserved hypothetical protein [Sphingomonas aurantiaca]|uniref:Uncharacterized protein n=1 Tax=Sphingomonas aurantiaca TaxID=185949 RepID=A0A5E7ZP36_9SPHN|nr:hypothetical protein [Sphingomonas aurantiaca]VVT20442.1 conserved hypothetical protein [Sphingomonas aurantiaca]
MKILRLRLGVRVPNEGARRLAQWIMREPVGTLDKLLRKIGMGQIDMERMMAGELTPAAFVGHQIFAFTRSAVTINDWYRPAVGGWFDVVGAEPLRRAA